MLKRAVAAGSFFPGLVFFTLAGLMAARLYVGYDPASPYSWAVYLSLVPIVRGVGDFIPAHTAFEVVSSFAAFTLVGLVSFAASIKTAIWPRIAFVLSHGALLIVLWAMNQQRVFAASSSPHTYLGSGSWAPNFSAANPVTLLLLAGVLLGCLSIHQRIIWKLRHPVRKVA